MTNPNNQAFQAVIVHPNGTEIYSGLTKREYAAIHILAGMASDPECDLSEGSEHFSMAVKAADLIIAKLNQPKP
mgnify:CR=1 FL=1